MELVFSYSELRAVGLGLAFFCVKRAISVTSITSFLTAQQWQ